MMNAGYDINDLYREAQSRWLKPPEVLFILQNHEKYQLTEEAPKQPTSGSLFLFNKRVLRFFRRDGHSWRKKRDGRTVGEAHERLKVGNAEALNCYYAHGEYNPNFQRRSYWMLDQSCDHIVLVHYRDISEGRSGTESVPQLSPASVSTSGSYSSQNLGPEYQLTSLSPGSVEVTSDTGNHTIWSNGVDGQYEVSEFKSSNDRDVSQALRRIEEQLSLNEDSLKDIGPFYGDEEGSNSNLIDYYEMSNEDHFSVLQHSENAVHDNTYTSFEMQAFPMLGSCTSTEYSSPLDTQDVNSKYNIPFLKQEQGNSFEVDTSLIVAQVQKFTIRQIVPEQGSATESTKVIIIGSFLCDPSESPWACMFGDIEVPLQIVQDGVLCCEAPPHLAGKVAFCITSGNQEPCSEVREFEYKMNVCSHCQSHSTGATKSREELLLLVRLVQLLLSDSSMQKSDKLDSEVRSNNLRAGDDEWSSLIEALLVGSETPSGTIDWLLQELLKDKLRLWLSWQQNDRHDLAGCSLSKKEQGVIHMIAGLGYVWALNPILSCGVNINFRDINGWTALHWAARFGREKMVAALIASGASAGAVTDPSSQDPDGKTAGSIADIHGHKGLAGYLSEVALTSHLSSLTFEESELSKGSAELEAEMTVNCISNGNLSSAEDYIPLKNTLAAVRNAAQAAARIQSAFRAHSFRKRQQKEAAFAACIDEYGIDPNDIHGLLAMSKLNFSNRRDYNAAALSIQKKYRGWKGRKEFLSLRQKVVKIQAHVRGYQVRKHYKIICWAVGILDKVVLRWRRKGVGLRGFRSEIGSMDESEDDDIIKVFRKQKVEGTIDEAVSRVLSMVDSPDARQQYHRMLEGFREAKAELDGAGNKSAASTSLTNVSGMEDCNQYPKFA
ncbi:calmodulin-binding transcription activator 4 [Benincasa hispida]|uniref:calmodulin-binding transcription activator 4 n=1 Tax=Benincasa hispida TaxID=102211 RepID=UPI0019003015|nr:calmodulin-binding transcription activator 4 [Benincasa hispida]XP_038874571.1 calmodulin-binding transcription activator 4 [Benincasa hispida]XP_038874572.1 calmodulin-binding transcription activator 4 [Benincasa hispida]